MSNLSLLNSEQAIGSEVSHLQCMPCLQGYQWLLPNVFEVEIIESTLESLADSTLEFIGLTKLQVSVTDESSFWQGKLPGGAHPKLSNKP